MAFNDQIISVYPEFEKQFDLSYIVKAGDTLYLSGLLSADDHFRLVGEGYGGTDTQYLRSVAIRACPSWGYFEECGERD